MKTILSLFLILNLASVSRANAGDTEVSELFNTDSPANKTADDLVARHKLNLRKLRELVVRLEEGLKGSGFHIGEMAKGALGGSFMAQTYRLQEALKTGNSAVAAKTSASLSLTRLLIALLAVNSDNSQEMEEYYSALNDAKSKIDTLVAHSDSDQERQSLSGIQQALVDLKTDFKSMDQSAVASMGNLLIWTDLVGGLVIRNPATMNKVLEIGTGALVMADFIHTFGKTTKEEMLLKLDFIKSNLDHQLKQLP